MDRSCGKDKLSSAALASELAVSFHQNESLNAYDGEKLKVANYVVNAPEHLIFPSSTLAAGTGSKRKNKDHTDSVAMRLIMSARRVRLRP